MKEHEESLKMWQSFKDLSIKELESIYEVKFYLRNNSLSGNSFILSLYLHRN